MKFIVNGAKLHSAMQSISSIITSNNAVPIVENFLLTMNDNSIVITATDLETVANVTIELDSCETDKLTQVLIPAKIFEELVGSMGDLLLTIKINEETLSVEITSEVGRYLLDGLPAEDYPHAKKVEDPKTMTLSSSLLVNAITKTAFATSKDEFRPQMTGIFCEQNETGITFVATDAHKLVRYRRTDFKADEPTSFILPKKPLVLVSKILSSFNEELEVVIDYNFNNVCFNFANYKIISRLIEGTYPNYEAAIPKDNPNKLTIDRVRFLRSVKRASIVASKSTHQIRMQLSANAVLILSSEDTDFEREGRESINCSYDGENMEIGFSAQYLQEMLSNIDTSEILLEMSQPSRAGIISPYNDKEDTKEDILMLLMPISLASFH